MIAIKAWGVKLGKLMEMRDLNGIHFPPINGMVENGNENIEGSKECLDTSSNSEDSSVRNNDCVEVVNEEQSNNNKEHEVEITNEDEEVAWSVKGISALASSIGKPVIMDEITTKMCVTGVGRIGFARVLLEIDAEKRIKDKIEIMYKSKNISVGTKKIVDVKYYWIPSICSHYKVFGHTDKFCKKAKNGQYDRMWNDRKNVKVNTKWQTNNRFEYRRRKEDESKGKELEDNEGINDEVNGMKRSKEQDSGGSRNFKDNDKEFNEEELVPNTDQRKIVDEALSKGSDDNNGGVNEWNEDMKRHYRDRKELFNAAKEIEENEDVMEEVCIESNNVLRNEVEGGLCRHSDKQKEVKRLIKEEGLQFCVVSETHKDLEIQKIITNEIPWIILGDFNVTMKVSKHSNGGAYPTSEMTEFQDCINNIELDDLHSEGFRFTWTKSLKNPKCGTLKKLDRIMVNEVFVEKFQQAHGLFLPYMIFDHSPIVVKIPNGVQKRKGSFRFSNFVTDKKKFLPTVRSV
nr:RNA-directed DNA polymerase, eukaryota, reverse transcriptase zinc-binding domain protein [Tanacetum cinerariifolium]